MKIEFSKYQGTGNDFILIDDRKEIFPARPELIQKLCDRRFGIGADGIILIQNHPTLDYRMVYFNPDGSQSLCGNGSRCGFAFAKELGIVESVSTFETTDGVHKIKLQNDLIYFQLFDVENIKKLNEQEWFIHTGSPHHIVLVDDVEDLDVKTKGREIRNHEAYLGQNGTNVNFAQLLPEKVKIRTYERGVESETLSCGTGATAVGIMAAMEGYASPVKIETKGGELLVSFRKEDQKFTNIWLAGPAEKVFDGSITI